MDNSDYIDSVPDAVLATILIRLDPASLALSAMACKRFARLIKDYQLRRVAVVRALGVKEIHGEASAMDTVWRTGLPTMVSEPFR